MLLAEITDLYTFTAGLVAIRHPSGLAITFDLLCVASPNDGYNQNLQENKKPQPLSPARQLELTDAGLSCADDTQSIKQSLHTHGRIVIMDTCKLSSRRRVASWVCVVLPAPGTAG